MEGVACDSEVPKRCRIMAATEERSREEEEEEEEEAVSGIAAACVAEAACGAGSRDAAGGRQSPQRVRPGGRAPALAATRSLEWGSRGSRFR